MSILRRKRTPPPLDELGGSPDGALFIVGVDGTRLHVTTPPVASSLRYFLTRAQTARPGGLPARLALTAGRRGEGVSYLTRSLGCVLAYDSEASVAVVDLNWTRPLEGERPDDVPTLADAVDDDVPLEKVIQATANPRLSLVPAGPVAPVRRSAMARSRALADVVADLSERFDHLLLDVPPVLLASDAILLTQLADAFALVVRHGATTNQQVEAALAELRGCAGFGLILNRAQSHVPRSVRRLVGV